MKEYLSKILLLIIFVLVISCGEPSFDEVARETSPNGKVDAVIAEINGGATTSFYYRIFLVSEGEKINKNKENETVASLYGAIRNNAAYGANLKWLSDNEISIEYLNAETERLLREKIKINENEIKVNLKSGIYDPNAPGGGMLYNLHKQNPQNKN